MPLRVSKVNFFHTAMKLLQFWRLIPRLVSTLTNLSCHSLWKTLCISPGGGGYLVYSSDGDVPFFRVSFSPIFSRTGYQKKANFLEQVVKTCQKRKLFSQIFVFLSILLPIFSRTGYHLKA